MSGLFSRRTAATAAALAVVAGGLVASTVAPSNAAVAVSGVCKIEAVASGTGAHVGWIGALHENYSGRTYNLSTVRDETEAVTFDVTAGSQQELFMHDSGARIGLSGDFENTYGFGFVGKVAHTEPGATSVDDPGSWGTKAQSSVWSLDQDGYLSATWIRQTGPVAVNFGHDDERDFGRYRYVFGAASGAYYDGVFPGISLRTSDCTGGKQDQAIAFTSSAPEGALPKGSYTVAATGGDSGNAVVFSSTTPGTCRVKGDKVTFIKNGTCTVAANQAGNVDYNAAPQVTQNITVGRIAQTIEFTSNPPSPANPAGTYDVTASGGASGNPVTLSTNPTICTVSGGTVTFVRTGKCVITAKQVGNSRYTPAPNAKQTVNVVKAPKATATS